MASDNASSEEAFLRNGESDSDEFHDAVDTEQPRKFHQFPLLHEDLQVYILSFLNQAPFEDPQRRSPMTHVLPYVSHQFYTMCQSDYIWQMALERLVRKDPLWTEGLLKLVQNVDASSHNFVRLVHQGLNEPGFLQMFKMVVERYLRFTGPVFIMSGVVRLGERIDLHFFEPRYRLLIANVMEGFPPEAREGNPIVADDATQNGEFPTFCYAHMAPFAPTTPACLVEVRQCTIHPNGSADVMLVPTAYVWMERLWEAPNTGRLHYAQCLRMPQEDARQLEERSFQQMHHGFENPLIEMLLQDRGLMGGDDVPMGLQLPLRAMLNYLVNEHGDDEDGDEDGPGIPAD